MRLHSCYFSKQNLETTVVGQGMLEMLFKGVLLLAIVRIMVLLHDYMHPFTRVSNSHRGSGGTCIYSGHCKVPDINRKSSVRESHYTSI